MNYGKDSGNAEQKNVIKMTNNHSNSGFIAAVLPLEVIKRCRDKAHCQFHLATGRGIIHVLYRFSVNRSI